jgi:hypothetical protein
MLGYQRRFIGATHLPRRKRPVCAVRDKELGE